MGGAKQSHRDGLFRCNECRGQFTVTVGTIFHRSKVPLAKWMQIVHLEAAPSDVRKSWQMAQATGLTHKTVERMRARIYAAAGKYRGPNTIFGRRVSRYVRDQRPAGYQNPPKPRRDGDGLDYRPWYAWRQKNPLGERLEARGVLAAVDERCRDDLARTERLLIQLLGTAPDEQTHEKWKRWKGKVSKEKPREVIPSLTRRELLDFGEFCEEEELG
jgi:hypothetical protein